MKIININKLMLIKMIKKYSNIMPMIQFTKKNKN